MRQIQYYSEKNNFFTDKMDEIFLGNLIIKSGYVKFMTVLVLPDLNMLLEI